MSVWDWLSQPWSVALTATLLHFLWQGTVLALLGGLLMRVLHLTTPHARYSAWLTVFTVMAIAPMVTLAISPSRSHPAMIADASSGGWSAPTTSLETGAMDEMAGQSASWTAPLDGVVGIARPAKRTAPTESSVPSTMGWLAWQPYVLAAWCAGVLLLSLRLAVGVIWLVLLGRGLQPIPDVWQPRFDALMAAMKLRRPPRIVLSDRVREPFAWQLLRPFVVLPASWLTEVPADVLEAVVAHELAHIRRHDLWVNLLQRIVETVLFFHPCVWWVSRQIRVERELCCDADAVAATGAALAYARALETVALKRRACAGPQFAVGMGGTRMALLHRVKRVLGVETSAAESGWWSVGLAGLSVAVACWAALTLQTASVQGDDSPTAVSADAVAQRDDDRPPPPPNAPRPSRDGDRPEGPRGPRDGEGPPPRGPRDGDRPGGLRGPRDGEGPPPRGLRDGERPPGPPREGGRGPEGRPGPVPTFRDDFRHREDFVPPAEAMHEMMRAIRELREEVHMLRRELNEMRGHGPGADPFGRPGRGPMPGGLRPSEGHEGDRGPEARERNRDTRPEGRERRPEEDRRPEAEEPEVKRPGF